MSNSIINFSVQIFTFLSFRKSSCKGQSILQASVVFSVANMAANTAAKMAPSKWLFRAASVTLCKWTMYHQSRRPVVDALTRFSAFTEPVREFGVGHPGCPRNHLEVPISRRYGLSVKLSQWPTPQPVAHAYLLCCCRGRRPVSVSLIVHIAPRYGSVVGHLF